MTIYLMVKTHRKTNLKYLCKTTNSNPHRYSGSGSDWKKHIKEHGNSITTEILKECYTKEELSYWGRYYSTVYNVVGAMDDFGNKIWANKIPETGGGAGGKIGVPRTEATKQKIRHNKPDQSGTKNGMYQKTHTEQAKLKGGDSNRGKDIKTLSGKKSIQQNMLNQWKDPEYRNNQIIMLKNRKGEKRSPEAIESYKESAKKRDAAMTKEQRSARTQTGVETKKIKYAGMRRKRIVDVFGKTKYIWINSISDTNQN
jgi:hypothetical protein